MNYICQKAYAKVNLSLDICGVREDGYHELKSVMQMISLCDDLYARRDDDITLSCNIPYIPTDERNIVYKVAKAFFEYTDIKGGVNIKLHKRVPSGAGLGGGSGDGAATIKLLDTLYHTHLSTEQMAQIIAPIGADLPFFLYGGSALAEGVGEKITPITPLDKGAMLLIKPDFPMSTPKIYACLDTLADYPHPDTNTMVRAVQSGDVVGIANAMGNSMQAVADAQYPEIDLLCKELKQVGALGAIMSGAGSTVFGLFESKAQAKQAALPFVKQRKSCYVVTPKTFE